MDSQSWQENEIAQAYDAKFQMLEAARKEYEQAVTSLLEEIRVLLMAKQPHDGLAEGVVLEIALQKGSEFAQHVLECALKVGNEKSWIRVVSRLSAPWVGTPGFLQLGVATTLNEKEIASSVDTLRSTAKEEGLWDQSPGLSEITGKIQLEPDWIHQEAIALTDPELVDVAADQINRLLTPASELALQIDREYRLAQRVFGVLEQVMKRLADFNADSDYRAASRLGWWQGMRFVQIDSKGQPSYWVGYHIERKCLMYGHARSKKCPGLAHKLATVIGRHRTEQYGGSSAGVLFDESEIEKTADGDLIRQTGATFGLFVKTVNECA